MRATLEQLKSMSDSELYLEWEHGRFPFEMLKGCAGGCLTMHADGCPQHRELQAQVVRLGFKDGPWRVTTNQSEAGAVLRKNLDELYALRLFYDSFYPQSVEATPSPTEGASSLADARTELVEKRP